MAWVDPEYAGEFAVVSAWLAALLPWSVSLSSPAGGSFVVVRFPFVAFQFLFGIELGAAEVPVLPMWAAPGFPQNTGVATAYTVWLAGGVAVAAAVALSVVYYARETDVEAKAPVDPARWPADARWRVAARGRRTPLRLLRRRHGARRCAHRAGARRRTPPDGCSVGR
jgi:hypothetical protein